MAAARGAVNIVAARLLNIDDFRFDDNVNATYSHIISMIQMIRLRHSSQ